MYQHQTALQLLKCFRCTQQTNHHHQGITSPCFPACLTATSNIRCVLWSLPVKGIYCIRANLPGLHRGTVYSHSVHLPGLHRGTVYSHSVNLPGLHRGTVYSHSVHLPGLHRGTVYSHSVNLPGLHRGTVYSHSVNLPGLHRGTVYSHSVHLPGLHRGTVYSHSVNLPGLHRGTAYSHSVIIQSIYIRMCTVTDFSLYVRTQLCVFSCLFFRKTHGSYGIGGEFAVFSVCLCTVHVWYPHSLLCMYNRMHV